MSSLFINWLGNTFIVRDWVLTCAPSIDTTPAETLSNVVSVALPNSIVPLIFTLPETSNAWDGLAVPIPTLPPASNKASLVDAGVACPVYLKNVWVFVPSYKPKTSSEFLTKIL